jgi:hypothetical protein
LADKISLNPPPILMFMHQAREVDGHTYVCWGVSTLLLYLPFFISHRASYFGHRFHTPPPKKKLNQIAFNSQEICNKIDKCMKSGNETYLELLVRSTGEPCGVLTSLCFAQLVTRSNLIKMARTVIQRCIVVCCLIIYRV